MNRFFLNILEEAYECYPDLSVLSDEFLDEVGFTRNEFVYWMENL